jgi:AcrR family transcriptional regulator
MWISKNADIRKQEFLDKSLLLFIKNGYEKTSINDILKDVGVTKGAFYYYFKSKDDVLECIVKQLTEKLISNTKKISAEKLSALEKINKLIASSIEIRSKEMTKSLQINELLLNDNNIKLSKKLFDYAFENSIAYVKCIIEQGVNEKIFHVKYIDEAAEAYFFIMNIFKSVVIKALKHKNSSQSLRIKALFYEDLVNNILGTENLEIHILGPMLNFIENMDAKNNYLI